MCEPFWLVRICLLFKAARNGSKTKKYHPALQNRANPAIVVVVVTVIAIVVVIVIVFVVNVYK